MGGDLVVMFDKIYPAVPGVHLNEAVVTLTESSYQLDSRVTEKAAVSA